MILHHKRMPVLSMATILFVSHIKDRAIGIFISIVRLRIDSPDCSLV